MGEKEKKEGRRRRRVLKGLLGLKKAACLLAPREPQIKASQNLEGSICPP